MGSSDNWLVHEHSLYEDLLSRCQDAVEIEDWAGADLVFRELVTHLKRHMALEEEVLYSAYEAAEYECSVLLQWSEVAIHGVLGRVSCR